MRRQQRIVDARNEVYYRLRNETTWSFPSIGRFLGDRDHSSVMCGARKHAQKLEAGQ
jgi:chromosomal replication initiation ATPase DnaA